MTKKQIFQLVINIKYLKTLIIPNFAIQCNIPKSTKYISNNSVEYKEYMSYFKKIANAYDCKIEVYKLQKDSFFYFDTEIISIGLDKKTIHKCKNIIMTIMHELAHRIQKIAIEKVMTSKNDYNCTKSFIEELKFERTAERLAYFLCKEYFPKMRWDHRKFAAYRNKHEIEWLEEYYKEWKNAIQNNWKNVGR